MPDNFKNSKKGLINILNKDEKCFIWCHIAYLYPATSHKKRVSKYKMNENKVNYEGITFPVKLNQIDKIEKLNKINFNIFTFSENEKHIIPLYISKINYEEICDMLLVTKHGDDVTNSHYVLITDLSKLLYNQNIIGKRLEYCRRCLQHFYSKEKLNEHILQ